MLSLFVISLILLPIVLSLIPKVSPSLGKKVLRDRKGRFTAVVEKYITYTEFRSSLGLTG